MLGDRSGDFCRAPGCTRPVFRLGCCVGHCKRLQRGKAIDTPIAEAMTPLDRVVATGSAWLESGDDDEYQRRLRHFLDATRRWMRANGWRPPDRAEEARETLTQAN